MSNRRIASLASLLVACLALAAAPCLAVAQEDGESEATSDQNQKEEGDTAVLDGPNIGVGIGAFSEDSRREGEEIRENETTDESFDYTADDFLSFQLWYLQPVIPRVRVGGGVRYFGSYELMREPGEDESAEDVDAYELGQMATLFGRAEWLIPFADDMQLILGAEAGGTILFPDGDFRTTIDEMVDQDISVYEGPRFGFMLAPLVGGRWKVDDRLAVRLDLSMHWQRINLLGVDDTVEGVDYRRAWTAKILRYHVGLGMEVSL
jgi:hypothetical protein